ncbi:hypothetical protein Y1Q_0008481 [Alligator mississippiensis]|uniref:Uncharacterized protein n=1 Tax=Alligator mississippiensis TaxID=8496 RepID=A0A151M1G4_ALLMI|nr:hypothetical protein Y1Q_0008481 [Alligator mississippiensis]
MQSAVRRKSLLISGLIGIDGNLSDVDLLFEGSACRPRAVVTSTEEEDLEQYGPQELEMDQPKTQMPSMPHIKSTWEKECLPT